MRSCIALLAATVLLCSASMRAEEKPNPEETLDAAAIDKLIEQLGDEEYQKRTDAQQRLEKAGPVILPRLMIARSQTKDFEAKTAIEKFIANIMKSRTNREWLDLAKSKDFMVRQAAATAIYVIGPAVIDQLCDRYAEADEERTVNKAKVEVWQAMNESLVMHMNAVNDRSSKEYRKIEELERALAIEKQRNPQREDPKGDRDELLKKIMALEVQLDEEKHLHERNVGKLDRLRLEEFQALKVDQWKNTSTATIPGLQALVEASTWETRWRAAIALGNLGKEAASTAGALKAVLAEQPKEGADAGQSAFLKIIAAEALWKVTGEPADARAALLELLKANAHTRAFNAEILGALAAEDAETVTALAALLKHDDQEVAYQAGWALRRAGPKAKAAFPTLKEALNDKREVVKLIAKQAIDAIENPLPGPTPPQAPKK